MFLLADSRIESRLRDCLLAAIRAGHDEGADVFADQILAEAQRLGIANGATVGDVLLAGAEMIETSRALDRLHVDRPSIVLAGGDRHLVVAQAEQALAQRHELYQRGGALVRVAQARHLHLAETDDEGAYTDPARVLMAPAEPEWLTTRLTGQIDFQRARGKAGNLVRVDAPDWLGRALIAERHWPTVRGLNGVTCAPIIRGDGSVRIEPGYDDATGMLLVTSVAFPPLAPRPTEADAAAALDVLLRPYAQYQFAAESARSVAVSLVLSRLARHLLPTVPLHLVDAAKAGTGKTMLVEAGSIIVDGVRPSLRAWPESDEEMRKSITACLLSSHGLVCFDNVPNGKVIASAVLDKLITNVVWEDRLLGGNANVYVNNNLVIAATGNNVRPSQDTIRRVVAARINTDEEEPWRRDYGWTPIDYVQQHRVELVTAACTLLSAYIRAGMPAPGDRPVLGTFEAWSRLVRNALMWLGMADPVETQAAFVLHDPAREALVDLLAALRGVWGDALFRCVDVVTLAASATLDTVDTPPGALRMALRAVFDGHLPDTRRLGRYYDTHRDEVAGGLRLQPVYDGHAKVNRWRVVTVERG